MPATTPDDPQRHSDERPHRPRSSIALVLLTFGAGALLLYVGHSVFSPIALSVLFAWLLSRPVEALHRWGLPRSASASVILLLFS